MNSRHALRAAVISAVATLSLIVASPAFALARDDGDDPGEPMKKMDALLVFVGIPFAGLLLIWIVCSAMKSKNPPYKSGHTMEGKLAWQHPVDEHSQIGGGHH